MFENGLAKPTVHGHCEVPGAILKTDKKFGAA